MGREHKIHTKPMRHFNIIESVILSVSDIGQRLNLKGCQKEFSQDTLSMFKINPKMPIERFRGRKQWERPNAWKLKINCAAADMENSNSGIGVVIRYENGIFIWAASNFVNQDSSLEAQVQFITFNLILKLIQICYSIICLEFLEESHGESSKK